MLSRLRVVGRLGKTTSSVSLTRRRVSIKSADEFFLPNLHSPPSTKHSTGLHDRMRDDALDETALYERDIELLDHELESLLGPLHDKTETDDDKLPVTPPPARFKQYQSPSPPISHALHHDQTTPAPAATRTCTLSHPRVVILNGPCSLVGGVAMQRPWASLQLELEYLSSTAGILLECQSSNHEGVIIDFLLNTSTHTVVIFNCGGTV
ncbi:hypothetical protein, variant [Aphanomyces invadans]|uniref:Uncharacterized protein n=1 Tax=Aphanomyces invadans TaxID=157072 RepID=A0A024UHG6_9STRA|nr:hypothetical protein, variant [Aphanomyces invadans]ETW05053.1 hypothetical protein, variant [Aphanomyces invadans]|eukprot:XP_008866490.1 hypothetical protein, variant [Aphanomyces invadans]